MKKKIMILSGILVLFLVFNSTTTMGSGTYTPTQTKIRFKVSERLSDDYKELPALFGVTKTYQHKQDDKTVLSYKVIEEEYDLDPQNLAPKKYVQVFKETRHMLLSVNGASELKIKSFKLDRKKSGFYKYKISGTYKRYGGDIVNFHEVHFIQKNVFINIQVITMGQGNETITKDEAFSVFDEILESLDEV